MPTTTLTPGEIAERGEAIYSDRLREQLEADNVGKFLVIDIDTGEYEIGDRHYLEAADAIHARKPDAVLYILKMGYPAAVSMGGRLKPNVP